MPPYANVGSLVEQNRLVTITHNIESFAINDAKLAVLRLTSRVGYVCLSRLRYISASGI